MSLSHAFKVRLCNFKATGVQSRGHPPFCIRGNFDGKPFNTEYFNSASMSPMWALDTRFDFHTPNLDVLGNKYLLLECYGADIFIGMCRVDLRSLATGPTAVELSLREGHRVAGTVSFEAFFEHVTNTTLQLTHVSLQHVASRGPAENGNPCPYISLGFSETGCTLESMVAPSATSPEWDRLPPLHKRCTYHELNDTRLIFELKHARNGFSPGVSDPLMASFDLHLGTLPIEIGRDSYIPVRIMVHSTAQYAFPFSTPLVATLEVRNAPKLVQLRGGLLTDSGVVGGIQPVGAAGLNVSTRPISPRRVTLPIETSVMRSPPRVHSAPALPSVSHSLNVSRAAPIASAAPIIEASEVRSADIDLLDEVGERQSVLLSRVQSRLQDVSRRRADVIARLDELVGKEEERVEATKRRKASLEADLRTALAERDRIEEALRQLQMRREEEQRLSADQAADRERMRRDLEEEQREVEVLQNRVTMLRDEMERHLLEEQERYAQRVREAEDARRRAQQDAEEFAMIEARLAEAEARAAKQQRDHDVRHQARLQSALSPSRHR